MTQFNLKLILLFSLLNLSLYGTEKEAKEKTEPEVQSIIQEAPTPELEALAKKYQIPVHAISYAVHDFDSGEELLSFQSGVLMPPASVMKIPTCLYALSTLGANYRFETKLFSRGQLRNGVFVGDIYLVGGLDPQLTATKVFELALALKKMGVQKVQGQFYLDESLQPTLPSLDLLGNLDQTYNPGLSALSVEFNRFRLMNHRGSRTTPKTGSFNLLPPLEILQMNSSDDVFHHRQKFKWIENPEGETWQFSTHQVYHAQEEIPVRNPAVFTANLLKYFAAQFNIELPSPKKGTYIVQRRDRLIHLLQSPELVQICESTLEYSNNLLAEKVLLAAAKKDNSKVNDLASAAGQMKAWLLKTTKDKDWEQSLLMNGSGLNLESRMSTRSLTKLLHLMKEKEFAGRSIIGLLSLSGQSGWVRNRFHSPALGYKVLVKTGSLDFTSNLSGLFFAEGGRPLFFSLFLSQPEKRLAMEESQSNTKDQKANRGLFLEAEKFRNSSHGLTEELLEGWTKKLSLSK